MRANPELISALRRAASRIEDPMGGWDWYESQRCNCGILAQELGVRECDMLHMGAWENAIDREVCLVTGRSLNEVFATLRAAGLDRCDIIAIEKAGSNTPKINRAEAVSFLRKQADILEEQLTPPPVREPVGCVQPCAHLFLAGCCVYCSHVEPVTAPVKEQL